MFARKFGIGVVWLWLIGASLLGDNRTLTNDHVKVTDIGSHLTGFGDRTVASVYDPTAQQASVKGNCAFTVKVDVTPTYAVTNVSFRYVQLISGVWKKYLSDGSGHGFMQDTGSNYMIDHIDYGHWMQNGTNEFDYSFGDLAGQSMGLQESPPTNRAVVSFYFIDYVQYSTDNVNWHTVLKASWHVTGDGTLTSTGKGTSALDSDFAPSSEQPDLSHGNYVIGTNPAPTSF